MILEIKNEAVFTSYYTCRGVVALISFAFPWMEDISGYELANNSSSVLLVSIVIPFLLYDMPFRRSGRGTKPDMY